MPTPNASKINTILQPFSTANVHDQTPGSQPLYLHHGNSMVLQDPGSRELPSSCSSSVNPQTTLTLGPFGLLKPTPAAMCITRNPTRDMSCMYLHTHPLHPAPGAPECVCLISTHLSSVLHVPHHSVCNIFSSLWRARVSVCLSVCLSVCPSVGILKSLPQLLSCCGFPSHGSHGLPQCIANGKLGCILGTAQHLQCCTSNVPCCQTSSCQLILVVTVFNEPVRKGHGAET